jgi:hypothetical protein
MMDGPIPIGHVVADNALHFASNAHGKNGGGICDQACRKL